MSNGHTPGPWIVDGSDISPANDVGLGICAISPVDLGGAKVWHHGVETYANAHLIAAAPELLEALTELADLVEAIISGEYAPDSFTTQPARAAIAKARGTA
ncbi:hypothetical protein RT21_20025 [Pseudomonas sp. 10B238]|uniref:hypothetical protein n=1 Tax=Pseudomonas sp. 10B238 TaxID=1586417 RepID=UPI00061802B6|nr:hypothetical protein [Pseudomonas sp. 10B238]KJJ61529.1 hypothetical protein RT21_20025 [Pseudomonas sp. 10B238]